MTFCEYILEIIVNYSRLECAWIQGRRGNRGFKDIFSVFNGAFWTSGSRTPVFLKLKQNGGQSLWEEVMTLGDESSTSLVATT